ncbi:hypothetical protein LPJ61_002754 [Coemansia biformis]|uniref:Uncharacterized protein n=1 Tax=Coemansia biformis TaxID=1286918 RepID=A0A9W7YED0_9FUNG|nr:hypothetical protein LPJ61_002754 [Coemansia biformis]
MLLSPDPRAGSAEAAATKDSKQQQPPQPQPPPPPPQQQQQRGSPPMTLSESAPRPTDTDADPMCERRLGTESAREPAAATRPRAPSNCSLTSSVPNDRTPPRSPHFRSNTGGLTAHVHGRRHGSVSGDGTPPAIRYTHSETPVSSSMAPGAAAQGSPTDDASKSNYNLWLPWEESALVDWLYDPTNRRLFNIPRRKKECHELIIRDVLPCKTSRAIEGKIRTLEKRYLKVVAEIEDKNFATKHPAMQPREAAIGLCSIFPKLEAIFKPPLAHARTLPDHHANQAPWAGAAPPLVDGAAQATPAMPYDHSTNPATSAAVAAGPGVGAATIPDGSELFSVPRSSPPPSISATESMPLPTRMPLAGRKIAPKRELDGCSPDAGGADAPPMMAGGKRSRTFPAGPLNHQSPSGQHLQPHQLHPQPQRSPLLLQQITMQQQQQRVYESGGRYPYDPAGRPSTANLPPQPLSAAGDNATMTTAATAAAAAAMATSQAAGTLHPHLHQVQYFPHHQHAQHQQSMAPSGNSVASMRDPHEMTAIAQQGATQGTREELEWLQFSLRREELEFRKMMFVREQELEARRVRVEEQRLENQQREAELESERMAISRQQMDLQVESLKTLTAMLGQMVGHLATGAAAGCRPPDTTDGSGGRAVPHQNHLPPGRPGAAADSSAETAQPRHPGGQ